MNKPQSRFVDTPMNFLQSVFPDCERSRLIEIDSFEKLVRVQSEIKPLFLTPSELSSKVNRLIPTAFGLRFLLG